MLLTISLRPLRGWKDCSTSGLDGGGEGREKNAAPPLVSQNRHERGVAASASYPWVAHVMWARVESAQNVWAA